MTKHPHSRPTFALAAFVASTSLLAGNVALAQEEPAFSIEESGWIGGAITFPDSSNFSHCGIEQEISEGVNIGFHTNLAYQTSLAVSVENWFFAEGAEEEVDVRIDELLSGSAPGFPGGPNLLIVPLGDDQTIIEGLRRGNVLYLTTSNGLVEVPLRGTFNAFGALRGCVDRALEVAEASLAEAEAAQAARPQVSVDSMSPEMLNGILTDAGLQGYIILDPDSIEQNSLQLQLLWTLGDVIAGVHQSPVVMAPGIESFAAAYSEVVATFCAADEVEADASEVIRFGGPFARVGVTMECPVEGGGTNSLNMVFTSDSSLYTVFMQQADSSAQAAVTAISEQLTAYVDARFEAVVEAIEAAGGEDTSAPGATGPITLPADGVESEPATQ